ncbi:ubiquitinyl hydrolase [Paraphysoderma sedebokerense]|nr:ubiquitinyl hydrolase [Paraphysoderma sedebokerense]
MTQPLHQEAWKDVSQLLTNWSEIESDPGVFTELVELLGAKDCQVEELYSFDRETISSLAPVYGIIFLFKYTKAHDCKAGEEKYPKDLFFSNQIIINACATQAILSILMNHSDKIDMGKPLINLKNFTTDFPPQVTGLAISNSPVLMDAHNKFTRSVREALLAVERHIQIIDAFIRPVYRPIPGENNEEEESDVFHFISFVPVNGNVYELDGLKKGPVNLGSYENDDWFSVVEPVLQKIFEQYTEAEIRFNIMALVRDQRSVLKEKIESLKLDLEKYSDDDAKLESLKTQMRTLENSLRDQIIKRENYKIENARRQFNYLPFVLKYLELLSKKPNFRTLVESAGRFEVG